MIGIGWTHPIITREWPRAEGGPLTEGWAWTGRILHLFQAAFDKAG